MLLSYLPQGPDIKGEKLLQREIKNTVFQSSTVQWIKNPTAVAQVDMEAQVPSLVWRNGLKDPVSPQLCHRSQLRLRFNPWPRNFHMPWVQPLKKKKKQNTTFFLAPYSTIKQEISLQILYFCFYEMNIYVIYIYKYKI